MFITLSGSYFYFHAFVLFTLIIFSVHILYPDAILGLIILISAVVLLCGLNGKSCPESRWRRLQLVQGCCGPRLREFINPDPLPRGQLYHQVRRQSLGCVRLL